MTSSPSGRRPTSIDLPPLAPAAEVQGQAPAQPSVLIVEDDEDVRALLCHVLEVEGLQVEGSGDAEAAMADLADGVVDLLLLDVGLPGQDGLHLLERVRADPEMDRVKVVLVTGREIAPEAAVKAGADAVVSKPFAIDQLLRTVDHQLRATRAWQRQLVESTEIAADVRALRKGLHEVIDGHRFSPVYQPIIDLHDGRTVGAEALTRFDDGTPPNCRFAAALRAGMGPELELATLQAAIDGASGLPDGTYLSVNISAAVACAHMEQVMTWAWGRPLVLELTEHERIQDYEVVADALAQRHPHVRIAVDDAGAGWASLRHVLALRPDLVKLDREWIVDIDADTARQALVLGIDTFAESFGGSVIAEGVETEAELRMLHSLGIPFAQGYHLGRPAPATAWAR
jgi:EAL domain-containing protein (putative c-di-GMP-specific phosphodiesterase class I)